MNRKLFLLPLLLIGLLAFVQYGCESDSDPEEVCEEYSACDVSATACCTDEENCHYEYKGKKYPDTPAGLEDLLAAMCPASSNVELQLIREQLNEHTLKLIEKARYAAICE